MDDVERGGALLTLAMSILCIPNVVLGPPTIPERNNVTHGIELCHHTIS
jgi:hypothetical protein